MNLSNILTVMGGIGGFAAIFWAIVDWARKDERQHQLTARLVALETNFQAFQTKMLDHLQGIERSLARMEGRLERDDN